MGCHGSDVTAHDVRPFELPFALPRRRRTRLPHLEECALRVLERTLGLGALNDLYRRWRSSGVEATHFVDEALRLLGIAYEVRHDDLDRIPAHGGLIVVANHPHGALDGLVTASLLARRRRDARLLGNYLLGRIPEMRAACILVDPFGDPSAARRNASGLREALAWVESGGVLVVFPSGEVAHQHAWGGTVEESVWQVGVARLAERTQAPVLPVRIDGANGRLFQWAGLLHPRLRTALLARELVRARGVRVAVHVGEPIAWSRLAALRSAPARSEYLRLRTLALGTPSKEEGTGPARTTARGLPVAVAVARGRLAEEVARLDGNRVLLEHGPYQVVCAPASQVPSVLLEIGRLRELAFRDVGEGTGRASDLDGFDTHYQHLFLWHRDDRAIAGAYRVGATDRVSRLYTRTLFGYDRRLLAALGPALELGRSFVTLDYQRDYLPLLLLWKGIGHLVARTPRYRVLYGPVSVSRSYSNAARELIARTLLQPRFRSPWATLVSPPRPLGATSASAGLPTTQDELQRWLTELEADGKGLPVLLRQYLKLNGRLLGFSVDPRFGHALDGLMVVDLADVDPATLRRYMGQAGAESWLAHHRSARPSTVPITPAEASA